MTMAKIEEWQVEAALKAEKAAWNIQGNWEREAMRAALEAAAAAPPGTPTLSEPQIQAAIKEWIERFGSHGPGIPEITTLRDVLPYIYRAIRDLEPAAHPKMFSRSRGLTAMGYHLAAVHEDQRSGKERRVRQNDLRMVGDKIHAQRGDALYPINRSGDDRRYQPAPPRFVRGSGCVVVDEGRKEERRNPTLSGAIQYFSYGNKDRRVHIDTTRDRRKPRG